MDRLDAVVWQRRQDRERDAWMLAHLLSPWSNRPIRPAEILGESGGRVPAAMVDGFVDAQLAAWEAQRADTR